MTGPASACRAAVLMLLVSVVGCTPAAPPAESRRPNIVLVITDDQGWAQLGMRGDPVLQTPHLDRFAAESVEFTRFYASPVCAPTRASLMTGRHAYRTGVVDTWLGRALMAPDETTIAEMLRSAGYRTGIFGKWHLGDSYPMRPQDQGFDRVVVHRGGGIGQPSDPPEGSDYSDPILFEDGEAHRFDGYVTDVIVDETLRFIDAAGDAPFFAYVATNAPHAPYLVPDAYREPYASQGLSDRDARIYGMITNLDDNVGRLLRHLETRGLRDDTIVVFMTDNGPTTDRFTAGLRARKGSTFEGGIRVPFFVRWPGRLAPHRVETPAAHIDVLPTLLEMAGVAAPAGVAIDGRSLVPLLRDATAPWDDRVLFIQAHRGDAPAPYRNFAAIGPRYKLVEGSGFATPPPAPPPLALFDVPADPGETRDLAAERPQEVETLRAAYDAWFADVTTTRGFDPQPIVLGADAEPSVTLTRQDWRMVGTSQGWGRDDLGAWVVDVRHDGPYEVTVDLPPAAAFEVPLRTRGGHLVLTLGDLTRQLPVAPGTDSVTLEDVRLPRGRGTLDVDLVTADGVEQGAWFVHVTRR